MTNPILAILAAAIDAHDHPVTSISVTAPAIAGTAVVSLTWSAWRSDARLSSDNETVPGVHVDARERVPDTIIPLPAMTDIERWVVNSAWTHGAWDIVRTEIPASYDGPRPPYTAPIDTRDGYVTWTWRPMLGAPDVRLLAARRDPDVTICPYASTRDGDVDPSRLPPRLSGEPRQHILRLGRQAQAAQRCPKRPQNATDAQRRLLAKLLADQGQDPTLPDDLDIRAASAWIDRLKGTVPPEPSRRPRKCGGPRLTTNQWRVIDYLRHLKKQPPINWALARNMTYADGAAMIRDLRGEA